LKSGSLASESINLTITLHPRGRNEPQAEKEGKAMERRQAVAQEVREENKPWEELAFLGLRTRGVGRGSRQGGGVPDVAGF